MLTYNRWNALTSDEKSLIDFLLGAAQDPPCDCFTKGKCFHRPMTHALNALADSVHDAMESPRVTIPFIMSPSLRLIMPRPSISSTTQEDPLLINDLQGKIHKKTVRASTGGLTLPKGSPVRLSKTAPKKKRRRFSLSAVTELNESYALEKYPSRKEKERLARILECSTLRVTLWFQNKRALLRKSCLAKIASQEKT